MSGLTINELMYKSDCPFDFMNFIRFLF